MHKLHELKEKLMKELEEYAGNTKFSKEDVEAIKYTAGAIEHICSIMELDDKTYSGNYMPMYRGGMSYARRRDAMGRYSRAGEDIAERLRGMMADAPDEHIRMEIERLANKVEKM